MFREMRRKKNELCIEDAKQLLKKERRGVLSVNGDDGYPYGVPIDYLYDEVSETIIFHGSRAGHKADAISANDKVCFTVWGNEQIKDGDWAPYLQSAVIFGRCRPVTEDEEKIRLLRLFASKYYPDAESVETEVTASGKAVQLYRITIEHLSGKQIQEK